MTRGSWKILALGLVVGFGALAGCGGGGSNQPPVNNPGNTAGSSSTVSGTVTDLSGSPIVGAQVSLDPGFSNPVVTGTTTQGGNYALPNVIVATGQNSIVRFITVTATVNGHAYSGQNTVEVLNGQTNTPNVHVVISPDGAQWTLKGRVTDAAGNPFATPARVFVAPGPVTDATTNAQSFTSLSSFTAYCDANGNYEVDKLPISPQPYTLAASHAGSINGFANVTVNTAGATQTQNFTLNASNDSPKLDPVSGFAVAAFTYPATATRATDRAPYQAVRDFILQRRRLASHRAAKAGTTLLRSTTRVTPTGSLIESDLFWDFAQTSNKDDYLFGYDILRRSEATTNADFVSVATLRDPLADRFSDLDAVLTPGTVYDYSVGRLDTIKFPNGDNSSTSDPPAIKDANNNTINFLRVRPLDQITASSPVSGNRPSGTPVFSWQSVTNAGAYQVFVYDRFPTYQTSSGSANPDGTPPIWPVNATDVTSAVAAPTTSITYTGPALVSGKTYYWVVVAQYSVQDQDPTVGSSYTFSKIESFVAP